PSMVLVPAQTFVMGDSIGTGRPDQRPVHPVTLSGYYIGRNEVTVQEYCDFLNEKSGEVEEVNNFIVRKGYKLSEYRDQGEVLVTLPFAPVVKQEGKYVPKPQTARQPMYYVTWEGAAMYCNYLSQKEGLRPCYYPDKQWYSDFSADGYHLPTEAQWECAARAGRAGQVYPWGNEIAAKQANYNNSLGHITDVGGYAPNGYGLHDMSGNVMEWCHDWYQFDYYKQCDSGIKDPVGPIKGGVRVIRGGAYYQPASYQTCTYRYGAGDTKGCFSFNGFRLARQAAAPAATSSEPTWAMQGNPSEMNKAKEWLSLVFASVSKKRPDPATLPFSFMLDGKSSSSLLSRWEIAPESETSVQGKHIRTLRFSDPKSKLEVACEITTFEQYPAVDMVLRITNRGTEDSGTLEEVCVLDHMFGRTADEKREFILRHSRGSRAEMVDFAPADELLGPRQTRAFYGHGGRSSDYTLPFMNLSWGNGGTMLAVGWSGQWKMQFDRDADRSLRLRTSMEYMHLKLHAGETIRTPRILLVFWDGEDMLRGHNLFRQLILAHYNPRIDGKLVIPPVAGGTGGLNGYTEENQLAAIPKLKDRGVEVLWMDAGWFVGNWPFGAGNWVPRPECFPNGLGPVGDAVHKAGMKFLLWFEIERASRGSRIARDFPQWVIGPVTEYGGLFNWGIPEARRWMTDFISEQLTNDKVDILRLDYNMDPLMYWQRNDTPDRLGMTEIRHVEGMYEIWDALRARHPGLWIDNCASGGRLIDLETSMRSIPLWQSDAQCNPSVAATTCQLQNGGLNLYLPCHSGGCFGLEPSYAFRSAMTGGNVLCCDPANKEVKEVNDTVATYKTVRPYFEGNYYPLFEHSTDESAWYGYQLHRPDQQRGMVLVFRRMLAPDDSKTVLLHGIDPAARYKLTNKDSGQVQHIAGSDLRILLVKLDQKPSSALLFYEKE
ncbi:MAG: SUMF1/EgtB/PvdO family nonheme iron enzyme, partial [Sedimentisphaerales bacterium]|nr:SUMF1/EgtB/PvdO family nonheme iron enzyme [Sedimentisphaerales bacterium]